MQEFLILLPVLHTYHGQESSICLSGSPALSSLPLVGHDFQCNHCFHHHVELNLHCPTFSVTAWRIYYFPFCSSSGLSYIDFLIRYLLKVKTPLVLPF